MAHKQDQLRIEQPDLFGSHLTEGTEAANVAADYAASLIVSEALAYIGPSIFMASFAESIAFAFGCISPMPAVLWFAAFSTVAVAVNWCLQMSMFLVIVTLDKRRELKGRVASKALELIGTFLRRMAPKLPFAQGNRGKTQPG